EQQKRWGNQGRSCFFGRRFGKTRGRSQQTIRALHPQERAIPRNSWRLTRMNVRIDPVIAGRIKDAWQKLSPDQQKRITPIVMKAHQQAVIASQSRVAPPPNPNVGHALPLMFSAISNDQDGVLDSLDGNIIIAADGGGEIWGTGKYEQLDPGWLVAGAEWLEHFIVPNHSFSTT